ncbi:hypothetical protein Q757_09080 [Oenococcus alcoholitolerans]|uniref:Uncharacterized protein n=1 Tax=Oenococcus alcoholitolerans TaxID=931074 RepID=A0ABR4XNW8_9LACO|nr:hypothetical protein Q757_09080 [Oenococcus alcoholitolerans]
MFASNTGMNIIGDTPNADEAALPLTPSVLAQIGRGITEASGIGNPNISVNVYPTNDMTEDGINKMSSKIVDAIQKNLFLRNKISNTVGTTLAKGVN